MKKLQGLCDYLLRQTGLPRGNFDAWASLGEIDVGGVDMGHGVVVCHFKYEGQIIIKRYPGDAAELLAHISVWLLEHDAERNAQGLEMPDVDVALNDDHSADVSFGIPFKERVEIVQDEAGRVLWNGSRWSVAPVPVDVAEQLDDMQGNATAGVES
jgi:hypothetical protein